MAFSERFEQAFLFAARKHSEQKRKGTELPYITHLMAVAALVAEYGGDEDEVIAGLLHDVVEDQGGKPVLQEIDRRFGKNVAAIVEGCSDTDQIPKPPWKKRKKTYHDHLRSASKSVHLVSIADKIHNARSTIMALRIEGPTCFDRFNASQDDILWNYRELLKAYETHGPSPIQDEYRRVVDTLHRLAKGSSE